MSCRNVRHKGGRELYVRQDNVLKPLEEHDLPMANNDVPQEYYGWWRIIDTSQWTKKYIDTLGTALISLTGYDDRLRMFALLAYVNCRVTKTGVSFTWKGAWEYDPVSGTGSGETPKGWSSLGQNQNQKW